MKKNIIAIMAALFSLTAYADDYFLNVVSNTSESYSTGSLQKITFEDGTIIITTTDCTNTSFTISSISKMYFSSTPLAISTTNNDKGFTWDGTTLSLNGLTGKVQVYQANGALIVSDLVNTQSLNLSYLAKGIYVVRVDGRSFKIAKK